MPAGGGHDTMSNPHATDASGHGATAGADHHAATDHGGDHDHAHGDDEEALGPIDPFAWGAGILGVGVAIAIAVCLAVSTAVG